MSKRSEGFLFAATGAKYIEEAIDSAKSIRRLMGDASIVLITDKPVAENCFDDVIQMALPAEGFKGVKMFKPHALARSPFETTVFLDSDTYMCRNCSELFSMADHADLLLVHDTADASEPVVNGQHVVGLHPYNSGVLVFKKSELMQRFFARWEEVVAKDFEEHPWDQRAMMTTILEEKLRVQVLQPIYNCRTNFMVSLPQLPVKIIHGRDINFEEVERKLNAVLKNRVWMPRRSKVKLKKRPSILSNFIRKVANKLRRD